MTSVEGDRVRSEGSTLTRASQTRQAASDSNSGSPTLSIGLAVRNGRQIVARCIESILAQDFSDFELVISDNVSDDGTVELLEKYAQADRRIRINVNPTNIGSHENMRRTLDLSRGSLFRWISADDWLEPGCLSACVRALQDHPEAIGVTTWFNVHTPGQPPRYEEYGGEFPSSPDPVRRFERMLWFFHAGDAIYDPIYGMYRREKLVRTSFPRASQRTDWLISVELALHGPILHLHERLANRTREYPHRVDREAFRRRLDPARAEQLRTSTSPRRLYRELYALAVSADLSDTQLRRCRSALRRFWAKEGLRMLRWNLSQKRHRLFASNS